MSEEIKSTGNTLQEGQQIIINQVAKKKSNGIGTAGFVLALIAICFGFTPLIGGLFVWTVGVLGLILSFAGVFKKPRGLAIAGLSISLITIIVKIVLMSVMFAGVGALGKELDKATKERAKTPENAIQSNGKQDISSSIKNEDFQEFIQKFKSDYDFQLSRIKFSKIGVSKGDWYFWDKNLIFSGFRTINGEEYEGKFSIYPEKCEYQLGIPFSGYLATLTFTKIDGQWYLTKFDDFADEDY